MLNRNLAVLAMAGAALIAAAGCTPTPSDNRFGGSAQAQTAPPGDRAGERGPRGREFGNAADRIDGRLAFIHAELRITRAQQPRFDAFAQALRDHARAQDDMRRSMMAQGRPATMPARLERIERAMTLERDQLGRLNPSIRALYAALTPPQRRTADELLDREAGGRRMMGMMRGAPPFIGRVEGRLAQLRTELHIRPDQETQWGAFASELRAQSQAAERAHAPAMGRRGRAERRAAGNLPAQLTEAERAMSAHIDALRRFRTSTAALYAKLDADQQRVFDNLIGPRGGPRRGRM
jgi:hypothetical protein